MLTLQPPEVEIFHSKVICNTNVKIIYILKIYSHEHCCHLLRPPMNYI
jgi:hypothetical protein